MVKEIKHTDVERVHFGPNLKEQAHHFFDMLWKLKYCTRDEAYLHLAEWLGVSEQAAHMAAMNAEQCKQVIIFSIQKLNDFRRLDLDFNDPIQHPYYELITVSKNALKKQLRKEQLEKLKRQFKPAMIDMLGMIFRAEICPYCKGETEYIDSSFVYGKSYGMIYICKKCDAYVGVHKDDPTKALGRLANAELREWKKEAHKYFDPIWKSNLKNRHQAYAWLSDKLNLPPDYTHIGMFGVETCKRVVELCRLELR